MIGTMLGAFELREQVGSGGMATVYRAFQPAMERFVAIKVIHPSILRDATLRDRFQREARLIAKLEHPHLLPIYDFDGDHDPPYLAMRFLEGGTLKQVMATGSVPPPDAIHMLRQIASALDYAHRQGIVHRDLKPSNILIDKEGNAFIADFGIARITDGAEDLTGTGILIGTPGYMAPEQARGESGVDHRADLYALAATVFELLAGRPPYVSESNLGVIMAHVNEAVPNICEVNADLPAELDAVMHTALAKERDRRFQTAGALVDAVARSLGVTGSGTPVQLQSMTQTLSTKQLEAYQAALSSKESVPDTPSDQQRQMTTVHFEVTELAEMLYEQGLETEAVRRHLDALWKRFEGVAARHGGVIKSRTDEVGVALWGVERASEDDAEQAIRAVLAMRDATVETTERAVGEGWKATDESPAPFLAGITTGPVLLERESDTGSFTASGATITLAGRLKDAAPPGGILVDHDSFTQVRGVFTFLEHPPVRVRGRRETVDVYLAVRARPRAFRLQARGIEGVETKMIGREIELRLLQEAMTLTLEDGETQVVTVVGEAGVGKSRLLYEFTTWIDLLEESLWFFEARATQPSMLQPYSLTRDLFSFRFQILDSDPLETVHAKFVRGVAEFLGEGSEAKARRIGQLVGFDFSADPEIEAAIQDPDGFQKQALAELGEFFVTASRSNPIFIQIEDIHWADDRSLDLINNLVRENTQIPLFTICMARPSLYDRRPQWGEGQRFHARVLLEPLSQLSSRRLVKELLKKAAEVPAKLRDLIIDRAEGNPYYIEELIKALIDDGVIVKGEDAWTIDDSRLDEVRIPTTLTGVLQSRLDTLPAGHQQLLQRASVVGRVFWDAAVTELSEADGVTPGAVNAMLADLRVREMIFQREESSFGGTAEYVFRHAILRDVTYQTVVPRLRRVYHKRVGEWLLGIGGERADEQTPLVAKHFELAGETERAAEQLQKASWSALLRASYPEAFRALEEAQQLMRGPEHAERRLELEVRIGEILALKSDYEEARRRLERAIEDARKADARLALTKGLMHLARIEGLWQGDVKAARRHLEEALPLARELNDEETLIFALRTMGNLAFVSGGDDPEPYLRESLELARKREDIGSQGAALNSLANLLTVRERTEEGHESYQAALRLFRQAGSRFGIAMVLSNLAEHAARAGDLSDAREYLSEGKLAAVEIQQQSLMASFEATEALILLQEGKLEGARERLRVGLGLGVEIGDAGVLLAVLINVALWNHRAGRTHEAIEWLGMCMAHEASDIVIEKDARTMLELIREGTPDDQIEAALERGRTRALDEVSEAAKRALAAE